MSSSKHDFGEAGKGLSVVVRNNDIEGAIKRMKKKLLDDGLLKEMKERKQYEKPSVKRRRKRKEAVRRQQKMLSLRKKHEGF